MSSITAAYLCSGQGSQFVGMAKDLYDKFECARRRFAQANDVLGFDLSELCFNGPEEELRQTRVTQPALYVHSVIVSELLAEHGIRPQSAAGHSLGEYSALACAGAFTFETGLLLVKVRAEAMQKAGEERPGTMAAIVGLTNEKVEEICINLANIGIVVPANYNSPGQLVISGEIAAIDKAMEQCKSAGAKLVRKLVVSGAFHSPLMSSAGDQLSNALAHADIKSPSIPVLANVNGLPHGDAGNIRRNLTEQLLSPVRWTDCMTVQNTFAPSRWFEIGPGNVLAGLLKRTISGASATTIGTCAELESVVTAVPA